jgi:hypothetical protein
LPAFSWQTSKLLWIPEFTAGHTKSILNGNLQTVKKTWGEYEQEKEHTKLDKPWLDKS